MNIDEKYEDWNKWYIDHIIRVMKKVEPIEFSYKDMIYAIFEEEKEYLLKNNLSSYTHGDVSWNNVIANINNIFLIDWDYVDIRHPWFDLAGTFEHLDDYGIFLDNLINEYFDENVPIDFYHVYKVFLCGQVLEYLLYEKRKENGNIIYALNKIKYVYDYVNRMEQK